MPAKALVGEAGDGVCRMCRAPARAIARVIPEAQGSGSLALSVVGLVDALKQRRADGTALTGTLDDKQPVVDGAGLGDQLGQVLKAGEDVEVGGLLMTASIRSARPSLRYCLSGECL